jgi:PAS domain S-box-containing protein
MTPPPAEHDRADHRADHQSFRRAFELLPELVCEWATDGTILFTNRAYLEYFGFDQSPVGTNLQQVDTWEAGTSPADTIQHFLGGEEARFLERHYDGGRTVEWTNTLVMADDGSVISVLAVGRDVTEAARIRAEIRRSEERFRTMVTHIWDSILLLDGTGSLIDATSTYRTDLGYEPEFWTSANIFDIVHPDDRERAAGAFADLLVSGPGTEAWAELRATRRDGTAAWLELNAVNRLDDPSVAAIIITVRNIDKRKAIEHELARRHEEAETALRQRENFVAQVSHELRNPLHGMLGLSELLRDSHLPGDLGEAANALFRQSAVLRRIVDDLLDVAQLEVGSLRVQHDDVDLRPVVSDAIALARDSAHPGVTVTGNEPPSHLRFVRGDSDRIRQAVANLLSNACKHTREGEVRLVVVPGTADHSVRIEVLDTGSGIDAADVERLFLPYQRGRGDGGPGVGLGLAIVKGTIEAMGGSAGASPRQGGGSVFWIELPATSAPATPSESPPAHGEGGDDAPLHVLVVDDDPVNRMLAVLQLQRMNCTVVDLATAEEALELIRGGSHFDVAFIDVQLDGMSGLELVRAVRTTQPPHPLLAVMTASATAADRLAAEAAGADEFVPKPATAGDMAAVLRSRRST